MLQNKYNVIFPVESIEKNVTRLTNQMWKLIPMRENNENWHKQLETVITDIAGLSEVFLQDPQFLHLLAKLESLRVQDLEFGIYRKVVFEAISLIQEIKKNYGND